MPAPTIPLHKSSGRIWTSKPEISTDGHLSTFVFPSKSKDGKDAKLGFSKTAFALGSKAR